ncbi:MAG: hypothetical protein AABY07_00065 [Nanoarchaeota archaeon]
MKNNNPLSIEEIKEIAKKIFLKSEDSDGCTIKDIIVTNTSVFDTENNKPEVVLIVGEGNYPYSPDWSITYSMKEINSFNQK